MKDVRTVVKKHKLKDQSKYRDIVAQLMSNCALKVTAPGAVTAGNDAQTGYGLSIMGSSVSAGSVQTCLDMYCKD